MQPVRPREWTIRGPSLIISLLMSVACGSSPNDPLPADRTTSPDAASSGGAFVGTGGTPPSDEGGIELPTRPQGGTGGGEPGGGNGASENGEPETVDTTVTDECATTEVSAVDTTTTVPADIIILVDTSLSMEQEAEFVQENLNAFSAQITESGVDARVILIASPLREEMSGMPQVPMNGGFGAQPFGLCIAPPLGSGSCPDDSSPPAYEHVPTDVGSIDPLEKIIDTYPEWSEYLRPEAAKSILVVTDDNAAPYTMPAPGMVVVENPPSEAEIVEGFLEDIEALEPKLGPRWTMNAVYSFTECGEDAARVGSVYEQLVELTGGVAGDLCLQDFQPVFDKLAEEVIETAGAEIVCEWEIPQAVDGQTFSTELVQVLRTSNGATQALNRVSEEQACEAGAWHFDDWRNPSSILACPQTCEAMQDDADGKIDVVFGCEIIEGCAASGATALVENQSPSSDGDSGVGCAWPVPEIQGGSQRVDVESVNVQYVTPNGFGVLVGQVPSSEECASVELGWHYDDPERPSSIVACPSTCAILETAQVTEVNALFGCETRPADQIR